MHPLRAIIDQLKGSRVLVIGDLMLDEYLRGEVMRISPEAPVPVLEVRTHETRLGGAANAAANIQALGGTTYLVGVVGVDETAKTLAAALAQHGIINTAIPDPDRPTSKKTRLVAQQQQIVRVDQEKRHPIAGAVLERMKHAITSRMKDAQAVVLSDYAKGVITPEIARHAVEEAKKAGLPIIVDPKQRDFAIYRGATVITPNLHELEAAAPHAGGIEAFDVERAAAALMPLLEGTALLVTRSADGMSLYRTGEAAFHVPAIAREVFDVTGAGDTVVATIALALAARVSFEQAIELASVAAAISVSKRGTSTVSPAELVAALDAG
jgi:D-beta-D-heptose 7-phosphate kinase/D-beta-D-heptose 1-phosphate adenosyltransferase